MSTLPRFLGDYLHQRRTDHGIALQEIERDIGIRPEYIEALEQRDFSKLPADIYLLQIVRQYARYLGLEEESIIKRLKIEKADFLKHQNKLSEQKVLSHHFPITGKKIFIGIATSVLSLVGLYIAQQFYHVSAPPDIVIYEPKNGITITGNNILVKGKTNNASKIEFNGKVISTDTEGNFNIPVDLKNGENSIAVVATSNNGQRSGEDLTVYSIGTISTPAAPQEHLNKGTFTLAITAKDTSWISIKTDGNTIQKTMKSGDKEEFIGKNIDIIAGNAGGIEIALNGSTATTLGDKGSVVRKSYSWNDANISYLNP